MQLYSLYSLLSLSLLTNYIVTVGTQAAVLAGLDITMFIEFQPPPTEAWEEGAPQNFARFLKFMYYVMIVSAFCSNMMVVAHTTALSVLGAGMALRGPDGSMMTATDGLYEERRSVFSVFALGLACTVGSVVLCVGLILHWEAALVCMMVTIWTCRKIYTNYQRVLKRFDFDESETVDFHDIFNGPAAIRVMSQQQQRMFGRNNHKKHTPHHDKKKNTTVKRTRSQEEEEEMLPLHHHHDPWEHSSDEGGNAPKMNGMKGSPVLRRQSSYVMQQQDIAAIQTV